MDNPIPHPQTTKRSVPTWAGLAAFAVLLAFLTLVAWGLRRSQEGPVAVGQKAPLVNLQTFDGKTYNTADYRGQLVLINFWASWCTTCKEEAVELEQAWQKYKDRGILFLGVDYVDTEPEAKAYLEQYGVTYPNGPDLRTSISQTFRIQGVPETYIIDADGNLAYVKLGAFASLEEIEAAIEGVAKP